DRRREPHVGLAHTDADASRLEARHQCVRYSIHQCLEQLELAKIHLRDALDHSAVVDRVLDPVAEPAAADVEPDVVEKALALAALVLVDAVEAVKLEADQLDGRHRAAATVSASTCSR